LYPSSVPNSTQSSKMPILEPIYIHLVRASHQLSPRLLDRLFDRQYSSAEH
jgi:hypothetical protein